jgi:hypothetical protein
MASEFFDTHPAYGKVSQKTIDRMWWILDQFTKGDYTHIEEMKASLGKGTHPSLK